METRTNPRTARRSALATPQRLELVGLFTGEDSLSISDMAARVGRPATSLYHHVAVLEEVGVLRRAGTRPKGKRFETLYELAEPIVEIDTDDGDTGDACRAISAALRMAERDFVAAINGESVPFEGPQRALLGYRIHLRASADVLARLNERLRAVEELVQELAASDLEPQADDQFVSLTVLLAPLRGRQVEATEGDPS